MRKIIGLDLNGWRDFAARDWSYDQYDDENLDENTKAFAFVDGKHGSVVVDFGLFGKQKSEGRYVGGPQAIISPIGRGSGWSDIGRTTLRTSVVELFSAITQAANSIANWNTQKKLQDQLRSAAEAVTMHGDEIIAVVPDRPELNDDAREFLLQSFKRKNVAVRLLWQPVAMVLAALEKGLLTNLSDGLRIACFAHGTDGVYSQILTLRKLVDYPGLFAPERCDVGQVTAPELALKHFLRQAETLLSTKNPGVELERCEPSRLPMDLLFSDQVPNSSEILRINNGNWTQVVPPRRNDIHFNTTPSFNDTRSEAWDVALVATPLAPGLAEKYADIVAQVCGGRPLIKLANHDIALGALLAGRRIESGIPHYLDTLEQISMIVLQGEEVALEDLVPENAIVVANKEFVSEPITGFGWPSDTSSVTFYLSKSEQIRKWTTKEIKAPAERQPVEIRLRQMPAQGRASVFVTSREWQNLRAQPIYLDWDKLETDPRSFEEIAAELKPHPVVPKRVIGYAHQALWEGAAYSRGFSLFIQRFDARDDKQVSVLASALNRTAMLQEEVGEYGRPIYKQARLLDFDGNSPSAVPAMLQSALDNALDQVCQRALSHVRQGIPLRNNSLLRAATWSFGRCPTVIQDEILRAAEAIAYEDAHPFLAPTAAKVVVLQGLGRVLKDEKRIGQAIDLLVEMPMSANVMAALSSLLARPMSAPRVLSEARTHKIAQFLANALDELRVAKKFGNLLNYALNMTGGLLRCRELRPYALLAQKPGDAAALKIRLEEMKESLQRNKTTKQNYIKKIKLIEDLIDMLLGVGANSRILEAIEELETEDFD